MSVASTSSRRILTVIAVAASLLLGFGAIRASAAWTAAAAPLAVSPVSAEQLKSRLVEESARSAVLVDRLTSLTSHANELASALAAAEARIGEDAAHAATLAKDLASAKKKLAELEKSIAQTRRSAVSAPKPARTTKAESKPRGDDGNGDRQPRETPEPGDDG
jgi:chromosome segregation ATPase